jgi:hypothetical protein
LAHGWRALRRRILTPDDSAALLEVRGFHRKDAAAQELLESIGKTFLTGYGHAAEAGRTAEAAEKLETIPVRFRGFAYEGAGMGFCVRDGLPFGRRDRFAEFLRGPAAKHDYMAYIGMGWAMARLPRFCWPRSRDVDPMFRWLVLDGYGFHQAYFHTKKYVDGQYVEAAFPWPDQGARWYANRAIDQGIGRAMWFVGGTDGELVASMIGKFPANRRADLFAGAGLAATYAGGADTDELKTFFELAGSYQPQVAQGSAFAAEARLQAGLHVPHTETATTVFCGMSPEDAARVTHETRPDPAADGKLPAYEIWRQRIAAVFPVGGVSR